MKVLVSVLIAAACLLAAPAVALSAEYTVDSTADEPDAGGLNGICLTAGLKCTLRAAIQESNASVGTTDTIKFAAAFNGELADTIALGAGFPIITDPVTIDGDGAGQCATAAGVNGPCAGVSGPSGEFGLQVEDDNVVIEGLAVTGALTGINVINASESFVARDNWLGVKLDGSAGANNTGIFLDPDSDKATIGGTAAAERNVIANNNNEGLDIEGASGATVRGNYFGVAPNGSTAAPNNKSIEITDSTAGGGFEAVGNEVGGGINAAQASSPACDGGCNVISGPSFFAIDLGGNGAPANEAPASGPTTIRGNYVGLNAAGTGAVANGNAFVILASAADDVTIGGPAVADTNRIAGGGFGVYGESGENLQVLGNTIGIDATGAAVTPPATAGMFIYAAGVVEPALIAGNFIRMVGGTGIDQTFGGTEIVENIFEGGQYGIFSEGSPGASGGNLIEGNQVEGAEANGILLENDLNEIVGNGIFESGGAGVRIKNPAPLLVSTENLIGGDLAGEENIISENGGAAIEIVDPFDASEDSANEVARNRGELNGGLFIDLVEDANNGIKPPLFGTSQQSSASGSGAEPNATVRVFRKASASPGEIKGFLAKATADGSGKWKVTYGSIPVGTLVAATQTNVAGATSELAVATTTADPSSGGGGSTGGDTKATKDKGKDDKGKGKADKKAPETTIVKKKIKGRTAKFRFVSSEAGSTFQCKLDKRPFKPCRSPKKYKRLKPGKHVFEVRAIDAAGNKDKTPAKRRFRVLP